MDYCLFWRDNHIYCSRCIL